MYQCPICQHKSRYPYAILTYLLGTCTRRCHEIWNKLGATQRSKLIEYLSNPRKVP